MHGLFSRAHLDLVVVNLVLLALLLLTLIVLVATGLLRLGILRSRNRLLNWDLGNLVVLEGTLLGSS